LPRSEKAAAIRTECSQRHTTVALDFARMPGMGTANRVSLLDAPVRRTLSARRKLAYGLLAGIAVLAASELAAQLYYRVRDGRWFAFATQDPGEAMYQYHPYTQVMLKPGYHASIRMPSGNAVMTQINSLGFRGPELRDPISPGGVRIACVGGSAV